METKANLVKKKKKKQTLAALRRKHLVNKEASYKDYRLFAETYLQGIVHYQCLVIFDND
jgi:hypothetical protein